MNAVSGNAHGDIVAGLKAGDENVLGKLLTAFASAIRRRLLKKYRRVLTADDIDDLLLIAIERAWFRRDRFDPRRGSLSGWLHTIADHAAVDLIRSPSFRARLHECRVSPTRLTQLVDPRSSQPPNTEPPGREPPWEIAAIRSALDRLPEAQREILMADATVADGVAPSAAIGGQLGITSSAVRSRRQRALARLRSYLKTPSLPPQSAPAPCSDRRIRNT